MRRSILDDANAVSRAIKAGDIERGSTVDRLARFARKVDRETRAMQREYPQFPCEFDRGHRNAIATLRRLLGLPPIKD